MNVHPIDGAEFDRFVNYSNDSIKNQLLWRHLEAALASGATSERWCLVTEEKGQWVGRTFLSSPKGLGEVFIYFFDAALDLPDVDEIAHRLLIGAFDALSPDDARPLLFALDDPHPWHPQPERRRRWFLDSGFEVARRTRRWQWPPGTTVPTQRGRLTFRALNDVGEDAFREAMARVSDGTLDGRLQEMRARLGREADAAEHLRLLASLRHQPNWFQLGFDEAESLVGLFAVGGGVDEAYIAYVGVVPEMRGQRYVDEFLARATALLLSGGEGKIHADTDVTNEPMAKAFERAGYANLMMRTDLAISSNRRSELLTQEGSSKK